MMKRTTIMLPDDLKAQAHHRARGMGISLGELIREALEAILGHSDDKNLSEDPLFSDDAVYEGKAPEDLSQNHDQYLYGEKQ